MRTTSGCPFSGMKQRIQYLGSAFSQRVLLPVDKSNQATESYEKFGAYIDAIFPEDFFARDILSMRGTIGKYPSEVKSIFYEAGILQIDRYFSEIGLPHEILPDTKMPGFPAPDVIKKGWGHACSIMVSLMEKVLQECTNDEEYNQSLRELKKILLVLSHQHLNVETYIHEELDMILLGKYISVEEILSTRNYTFSGNTLPQLGCPAVFFSQTRMFHHFFDWITSNMIRTYRDRSYMRLFGERVGLRVAKLIYGANI